MAEVYANGEIRDLKPSKQRRRGHDITEEVRYVMWDITFAPEVIPLLNPTQHRIILLILSDYRENEPWARMTASEMGERLGIASPNLYRALKPLRASGLVIRKSSTVWQVSPHYGWRGSRQQWEKARKTAAAIDLEKLKG